jgi:hypothetical protein
MFLLILDWKQLQMLKVEFIKLKAENILLDYFIKVKLLILELIKIKILLLRLEKIIKRG